MTAGINTTFFIGLASDGAYVEPYVASMIFFFITVLVGYIMRCATKLLLPQGLLNIIILDFSCTMVACTYFYENNFVLKHYGYFSFAILIITQMYVSNTIFDVNVIDNPVKSFLQWLLGKL